MRISRSTTHKYSMALDKDQLIDALNEAIAASGSGTGLIPNNAEVTIRIPSGGDYSGVDLEVDARVPIVITWEKTEQTDD